MEKESSKFSKRLEKLSQFAQFIKDNKEELIGAEIDSSLLVRPFVEYDIDSMIHVFSNYYMLIDQLQEKNINLSSRKPVRKSALMLPYNGPGMTFALSFAGSYILGVPTEIRPASESKPFFSKLELLARDYDHVHQVLENPDGSRIFSDLRGEDFLAKHLRPETGTEVIEIYGHDSFVTPSIESKLMKNPNVKIILEGPGKNRFVVTYPTQDLESCAKKLVDLATVNSGQVCMGAEIFDIDERVWPSLKDHVVNYASLKQVDDPYLPRTDVGPLKNGIALRVLSQVKDAVKKGAKIEFATQRLGREKFYSDMKDINTYKLVNHPTRQGYVYFPIMVLSNITSDMAVRTEETFGPIIPIRTFKELREIYHEIDEQRYGLGVHIFGDNLQNYKTLTDKLKENNGHVFVNASMFDACQFDILLSPWGGYKNSRFSIEGTTNNDKPATLKTQIGPSFVCLDLSK